MTDEGHVRWTRRLVLAGILLGFASYGSGKLGIGELYPFAHWRLYSEPVGINDSVSTYRVYVYDESTDGWSRQPLRSVPGFTRKEAAYVLNDWARRVDADPSPDASTLAALRKTAALFVPESADSFRVVEETFLSFPLYEDAARYDTSTVAVFDR